MIGQTYPTTSAPYSHQGSPGQSATTTPRTRSNSPDTLSRTLIERLAETTNIGGAYQTFRGALHIPCPPGMTRK